MYEKGLAGKDHEGKFIICHYYQVIFEPNGMQLIG